MTMRILLDHLSGSSVLLGLTASSKATLLLLAAALAGLALRRRSAAARHLVYTTALLGALALPIVSRFVPSWPLAVLVPSTLSYSNAYEETPPQKPRASRSGLDRRPSNGLVPEGNTRALAPGASVESAPGDRWDWLMIVWASGAAVGVLPLVMGLLNLGLIGSRTSPVTEPQWTELVRTLSDRLGLRRRVRLVKSSGSTMPMTWGWLRPVVLLPDDSERWPQERRRVVLLHELAHVRRLDCLTQQLARLSCAVYWFNPLSWWASTQMMLERERACDDLVLLSGSRPSEYAGHLLALAREQRSRHGVSMAAVAMARETNLEGRLRAILDARSPRRGLTRRVAAWSLLVAAVAIISLAGLRLEAQTAKVKEQPAPVVSGQMTVRGRVLDALGKPVPGAHAAVLAVLFRRLTCSYENTILKAQALADDQGRFRLDFPRVPDGDKTLLATAPGLGAGFANVSGSDDEETTIQLGPEQVVHGRLIDRQGLPAASVVFRVSDLWRRKPVLSGLQVTTPLSEPLPPWLGPLRTDAQGRFTLRGLPADANVTLQVRDDRFALQDLRIATGPEGAAKDEIVLSLAPPHLLEGRVTFGDSGEPAAVARLHVIGYPSSTTTQSFDRIDGQTGPDGRFRISASVAHHYGIVVDPPDGSPYFLRRLTPTATDESRQQIDVTLERGILVRGQIHDANTGQPVVGAIVVYRPKRKNNPMFKEDLMATGYRELSVVSDTDGLFRIPALPGLGHLLVKGPNPDFIPIRTSEGELEYDVPGGARLYPVGLLALGLDASAKVADVSIPLRRGATLEGRVVGPNGQIVTSGEIYSEAVDSAGFGFDFLGHPIQNGRFTLSGLDPEKTIFAFVFDAKRQLGASLPLSVPKDGRPVTVTLHPCGSARARFMDRTGKPLANVVLLSKPMFGLEMVLRLSPSGNPQDQADNFATTLVDNIDHDRYDEALRTDGQGQLTFPSLIPGATYRVMAGERGWVMKKEFIAEAGKTVELSDITIMSPE